MKRGLLALAALGLTFATSTAQAVDIQEVTSALGIKAWLVEDKSAPVIALSFSFEGGTATEPEARKGVTNLMATMLTDGAGTLPAGAFRLREEDTSASVGFGASPDRLSGSLRVLAANRDQGFDLLRSALVEPRFDNDMLEQRRAQALSSLAQSEQRPASVAERRLIAVMFAGHPYGRSVADRLETLKAMTPDDLKARAAQLLTRQGLIVAAVGDIDAAELGRQLDSTFGALPLGVAQPALPDWVPPTKARTIVIERPVPQSAVRMAMPGVARDDSDWYPALVLAHILGGGQQSRLFNEVREKRGLAYSISTGLRTSKKAALLTISTANANEHVAEALRLIRLELSRLRTDGVGAEELADAKTYLSGSLALSLDSSGAIASLLHSLQVDRLPRDILDKRAGLIAAVTADDVNRVARRLLRDEHIITVVVGKPVGVVSDP
jgi:zinc protease